MRKLSDPFNQSRSSTDRQSFANVSSLSTASSISAVQTVLARADLAYAQSILTRTHSKGNLGEALALRAFLRNKFEEGGNWISLTPRTGRQGFDHLFVRINKNGSYSFMVGESKYGSSQLGMTEGNTRQMSWNWIRIRANKLGDAYINLADQQNISYRKLPYFNSGIKSYDVIVNGQKMTFWRDSNGNWYFTGNANQLKQAQAEALKMGRALKTTEIRTRLFRIRKSGDDVIISIDRIKSAKNSNNVQIIKGKEIVLKGILSKHITDEELKHLIAEELKKKLPGMKEAEIKELAADLAAKYRNGTLIEPAKSIAKAIALQSLAAGGIAGGVDLLLQLLTQKKINWKRVCIVTAGTALGTAVGQITAIGLIKTKVGTTTVRYIAKVAGLKTFSLLRNSLAGTIGGMVSTGLISYGSALAGYLSWKDANREFIAGSIGLAGGTLTVTTATSLVATFAVAGTGTPIAALSGIAATNTIKAWFGLGLGMKAGGIVLGGIGVVATIAISCAATMIFVQIDKKKRRSYALCLIEKLDSEWYKIANNRLYFA